MPERGFSLPGSSYKELIKIVQGYGEVGQQAASIEDVARAVAIDKTIVSRNNRFLIAIGIVQGGKKKTVTSLGSELAHALQYGFEDDVANKWRAVVDNTEFLQKIVAAVRIRKGMDESSLESHVAYSAGQPKTQNVLTGAGTVVEILKIAGLLKEDSGGNLVATIPETAARTPETVEQSLSPGDTIVTLPYPSTTIPLRPAGTRVSGGVQLNIEVRIQCTPEDLEGLGHKLRKVLADFNQPEDRDSGAPASTPEEE